MVDDHGYAVWNPAEMLEGLKLESDALGIGNPAETAQSILKDSAPAAARSIVHMAIYSRDERTRLAAAKFVYEKATEGHKVDDPFADLLKQMVE